jgi:hypothetical protein
MQNHGVMEPNARLGKLDIVRNSYIISCSNGSFLECSECGGTGSIPGRDMSVSEPLV